MIDVLMVDDHPAVMAGAKLMLEEEGDIRVHIASRPEQALEMSAERAFDVLLIDYQMPETSGIDLSRRILETRPDATILIYTGYEITNHFNLMVESGISGFVLKTCSREQLVTAIRCAHRGESVIPVALLRQLRRSIEPPAADLRTERQESVTDRERKILAEIARGSSNKDIAAALLMSQRSLEYALTDLFRRLRVKSRIEAVAKANRLGLLGETEAGSGAGEDGQDRSQR